MGYFCQGGYIRKKIGITLIIIVVAFIAYNLMGQIIEAVNSSDRLSQAAEELYKLEVKNKELKKILTEIKSTDFIEKVARDKLGLVKEGEIVVIIPDEALQRVLGESKKLEDIKLPNWLGWWKVFF